MRNLKQRVYSAITGVEFGMTHSHQFLLEGKSYRSGKEMLSFYKMDKNQFVKRVAKEIEPLNNLTQDDYTQIIDAIDNKKNLIYANSCYESLKDSEEIEDMKDFYKDNF